MNKVLLFTALAALFDPKPITSASEGGFCGDGWCDSFESCGDCPSDCGSCSWCGDGICDWNEACSSCSSDCGVCVTCGDAVCSGGESEAGCPEDCSYVPPGPGCSGMNLISLHEGDTPHDTVGPSPTGGGNCNCVVRVDTTDRVVTGVLYQECNGHWQHGSCPQCSDWPHSAPFSRWGVELTSQSATATPLTGVSTSDPSRPQNHRQWPSTAANFEWNTCTCDTLHFPEATHPNPVATERARAGWFKVRSTSSTCSPLATGGMTTVFALNVWDLDPGFLGFVGHDDLVTTLIRSVRINQFTCDGAAGFCTGSAPVSLANGPIAASGIIEVECRSRAWGTCESECGVTRFCGTDSCGNDCGPCPGGHSCIGGYCQPTCTPCAGQQCGYDMNCSTGTWCGSCSYPYVCEAGGCVPTCTDCAGQQCGWDLNCSGTSWCGSCPAPYECFNGSCVDTDICVVGCGDGECCSSETDPSSGDYCPADCGGGGGGGGGGGDCTCDCDGDGWVTEDECVSGCGGYVDGDYCIML